MTEVQLLGWLVCCLALVLALNLKLTFTLYKKVRDLPGFIQQPEPLLAGTELPQLTGTTLLETEPVQVWQHGYATALLFLASRCSKCKQKLAELPVLLQLAQGSGLEIKLITTERARPYQGFLAEPQLAKQCIRVRQLDYLQLNPQQISPAYLFIDQQGQVEATGLIGDENWLLFCEQLQMMADAQQDVA